MCHGIFSHLLPQTDHQRIYCTDAAQDRLDAVGTGHLAKVEPEGRHPWPLLARLESIFVRRHLLFFWTWPTMCTLEVGLIGCRFCLFLSTWLGPNLPWCWAFLVGLCWASTLGLAHFSISGWPRYDK
jgi:hypothetical protein